MGERIAFVGDLMLGEHPLLFGYGFDSWHAVDGYAALAEVAPLFMDARYVVGNFEATIKTRAAGRETIGEWSQCCDERIGSVLRRAGFTHMSVANNHTMDYGEAWFDHTIAVLRAAGIEVLGLRKQPEAWLEVAGRRIAVVGVSYLSTRARRDRYFAAPTPDEWAGVMPRLAEADRKIAYVHWGNEFITRPTGDQVAIARQLIALGFDAIIGHHPHISQPAAMVDNTPVFFSLGNFISDAWQDRLRDTVVIDLHPNALARPVQRACRIDARGIPRHVGQDEYALPEFEGVLATLDDIARERARMRRECLRMLAMNFHRIKGKGALVRWVWKRLLYFLRYGRQERQDPSVVYQHYRPD